MEQQIVPESAHESSQLRAVVMLGIHTTVQPGTRNSPSYFR